MRNFIFILFFFISYCGFAQKTAPNYIKSIVLRTLQEKNYTAIIPLGSTIELSFDDLEADQKNYYYKIEQQTHDWKPSKLLANQYIEGFNSNVILSVENSFNTLQNYTHYKIQFPNQNTRITKSGNYLVSVLNSVDEVIFSRRFVLYESLATVGIEVTRGRNANTVNEQQNVRYTVNHPRFKINNPNQEIHTVVLQNENWNTAIANLNPKFFKSDQLVYNYNNKLNFWGGNEYLFFDTKVIRNTSFNIAKIERKQVFYNYLYPTQNPLVKSYTYNPDINGQFIIRTIEASNSDTEADYALMHFTLESDKIEGKEVYIYGAFNNFQLTEDNKMRYDESSKSYRNELYLKQGFYNYTYVTKTNDGFVSQKDIRGDFSKTENEYTVIVYYKPFGKLYDRVIGVSSVIFNGNR